MNAKLKTRNSKLHRDAVPPFVAALIKTETHIVTRDGAPCTLINVSGLHKGGVLIPGAPAILFTKVRDAERAIERTERVRETLRTSLVAEWLRQQLPSFTAGRKFAVVAAGHQVEPAALLPAPKAAAPAPARAAKKRELVEA